MSWRPIAAGLAVAAMIGISAAVAADDDLAVRGGTVYTMAGEPINDGVVLILGGKIATVGPASTVEIPAGVRVVEAPVVTPGLIDAHTVVGLAGYLNQNHDQDQLERSAAIQPELRAIDAYNARERLVAWLRDFGITTIHTGHGPGEIVSGQTMIVKTVGDEVDDAVVVPEAMLAVTLGEGAEVGRDSGRKSPGTRSKAVAMLRAELIKAREYARKRSTQDADKKPATDLGLETLAKVLDGTLPLLVTVQRHNDILAALRLKDEFGFRMVLDGASEAYLLLDRIKQAGVPVIVHPTMTRAWGERENLSMSTAAKLVEAGIPMAFQSGFESYVPKTRVVLFEAAVALAHGLAFDDALEAVTIGSARVLGIDDRLGSLEGGKDGDVALYDGDPFEYTSHCLATVIDGVVVAESGR